MLEPARCSSYSECQVRRGHVLRQTCRNVVESLESRIFLSDGPDLTVTFGEPAPLYPVYVPGDSVKLPVTVQNLGNRPAVGTSAAPIIIDIRASLDSTYDASDVGLATVSLP